jgi:multidrug efflux pump subunit AcrA (membrane-fusion protein)
MKRIFRCHRRRSWFLVLVGLMLALLTACETGGTGRTSAGDATPTPLPTPIVPEKPVYSVQAGTVVQTLEFTGRASPVLEQELFFETNGNVSEVFVARGDWVESGQVLAQLGIDDLQSQLAQRLISLQTAELRMEQAQIEASEAITTALTKLDEARDDLKTSRTASFNDLAEARAAVQSAEVSLDNAKLSLTVVQNSDTVNKNVRDLEYEAAWYETNYGEYLKKFERGEIDQTRLDLEYNNLLEAKEKLATARTQATLALSEAEARIAQAEESLRQARARLAELQGQPSVSDAEAALRQAEQDYDQALEDADPESLNMRLLGLDLEQTRLDITDLEGQIADARLVAPFAGQILTLNVKAGDSVQSFDTVGVLADPAALEITAELGSEELSQMALNQEAVITLRDRPGETFFGTVRQLPYPYGGGTVDTGDDDTAVHIALNGAVDLELGELATVSIVLEEKQNVLWLPPAAIRTYQGRDFVVVQLGDGSQQRVDVLLGIITDERVEVEAGLEEGQVIVGE